MELIRVALKSELFRSCCDSTCCGLSYSNTSIRNTTINTRGLATNDEQVAQKTGADWVLYQELEDLEDAVREVNPDIPRFDSSCFWCVFSYIQVVCGDGDGDGDDGSLFRRSLRLR